MTESKRLVAPLVLVVALVAGCGAGGRAPGLLAPPAPGAAPSPLLAAPPAFGVARPLVGVDAPVIPLQATGLFAPDTWEPGHLAAWVESLASAPEDPEASGRWASLYAADQRAAYLATLGGLRVTDYDPAGFLATLGLPVTARAPGRRDADLFKAFKLTHYAPDPHYLPGPDWLRGALQSTLLRGARLSPGAVSGLDRLVNASLIHRLEKADRLDPDPYGRVEDIVLGPQLSLATTDRYAGVLARRNGQYAWDVGIHGGSLTPTTSRPDEHFGTYDLALGLGFSASQAERIARADMAVDEDMTHYQQNGAPRKTAARLGAAGGDLHWHYNRAAAGEEDTRLVAARVHLARAKDFARTGYYDTAEEELGIGLHGLQDMFSHGQITPLNHALLGEFPDIMGYNPVGMMETAIVTEGFLKLYLNGVLPAPVAPAPLATPTAPSADARDKLVARLVQGNLSQDARAPLRGLVAQLPDPLLGLLDAQGIRFFYGKAGTKLTELGFGTDLDHDGVVTPDRWVDVDADGVQAPWEVEGEGPDGGRWNARIAAYSAPAHRVFLSAEVPLEQLEALFRHELAHVLDDAYGAEAEGGARWREARRHQLRLARRSGAVGFSEVSPEEHFADAFGAANE